MKRDKQLEEAAAKILYRGLQEAKTPSKSELEDGETGTAHGGMQHFSTIDGKQWVWNYALKSKSKSLSSQPGKWEYTNKKDQATAIAVSTWGGKKLKVAKMIEEDINLEEGIDIEWIESNFTVVTDDNKGNPTIEWTDGNWYRILLNKIGKVVNVEPREDDPGATRQNARKILRAIQHRIVAEDTTAGDIATNPAPLGKKKTVKRNMKENQEEMYDTEPPLENKPVDDSEIVEYENISILSNITDEQVELLAKKYEVNIFRNVDPARGDDGGQVDGDLVPDIKPQAAKEAKINVSGPQEGVHIFLKHIGYSPESIGKLDDTLGIGAKVEEDLKLGYSAKATLHESGGWIGEYTSHGETLAYSTGLYEKAEEALEEISFLHGLLQHGVGDRGIRTQMANRVSSIPGARHRIAY